MTDECPDLILIAEPPVANCCVAAETEYQHVVYGTGRATIKLPTGPVQVSNITSRHEFATDREIADAEYRRIRRALQEAYDCAFSSNPGFLLQSDDEIVETVKRSGSPFKIPEPAI